MRKPEISVIIPTYNSADVIERCLESLVKQHFRGDYEILVIDCSTDGTPEVVKKFRQVKLFLLKKRVHPGEARNVGIKKAKGDVIAFIDSDCVADTNWLNSIRKAIGESSVVGGSVDNGSRTLVSWADHFLSFGEFLPGIKRQRKGFVPTCNVAYRRGVFREFGLFPSDRRASEDVFFNTLVSQKESILFEPEMRIVHYSRERMNDYLKHQYLLGRNAAEVRKQRKDIYGSFLVKSTAFGILLPFIRTFNITKRVWTARRKLAYLYIMSFPLVFIGLLAWSLGFSLGVARKHEN